MDPSNDPNLKPPVDETRRRLAKAGLAAPAVLGALASRPVLAKTPYHCTISGLISGNLSKPKDAVDCGKLGKSPGYWKQEEKDSPIDRNSLFKSIFADAYSYQEKNNKVELAGMPPPPGYSTNPTLMQVLHAVDGMSSPPYPSLGRAAVASYLNALYYAPDYPLTPARVVAMFNAVYNGGTYAAAPGIYWNATQVKAYFESLYDG